MEGPLVLIIGIVIGVILGVAFSKTLTPDYILTSADRIHQCQEAGLEADMDGFEVICITN